MKLFVARAISTSAENRTFNRGLAADPLGHHRKKCYGSPQHAATAPKADEIGARGETSCGHKRSQTACHDPVGRVQHAVRPPGAEVATVAADGRSRRSPDLPKRLEAGGQKRVSRRAVTWQKMSAVAKDKEDAPKEKEEPWFPRPRGAAPHGPGGVPKRWNHSLGSWEPSPADAAPAKSADRERSADQPPRLVPRPRGAVRAPPAKFFGLPSLCFCRLFPFLI